MLPTLLCNCAPLRATVMLLLLAGVITHIHADSPDDLKTSETILTPFNITGRVTTIDGDDICGAQLEVYKYSGKTDHLKREVAGKAVSSSGGVYAISGNIEISIPHNTSVMLRARRQGNVSLLFLLPEFMAANQVGFDVSHIEKNLVMPASAKLEGTVANDGGSPLAGAVITGNTPKIALKEGVAVDTAITTSSAEGAFKLDGLPAGEVNLTVIVDGKSVLFTTATAPVKDMRLVVSSTGSTVTGSIILPDDTPVTDAEITLYRAITISESGYSTTPHDKTRADANGQFAFTNVPGGDYRLYARADSLSPLPEELDPEFFHLEPGQTTSGIKLRMYKGTTITGKVTEIESGAPIPGVTVYWGNANHDVQTPSAVTDSDGNYKITGALAAPGGNGGVYVKAPHHVLRIKNGDRAQELFGQDLLHYKETKLPSDAETLRVDLELTPTRTLAGTVHDENGAAMTGVEIFVGEMWNARGSVKPHAVTDAEGQFTLQTGPDKGLHVYAKAEDHPVVSVPVPAPGDAASSITITIYPPAAITGIVLGPDGQAVGGAHIQVNRNGSASKTGMASNLPPAQSAPDGTFAISDLPGGKISLVAQKEGYVISEFMRLELKPGEKRGGVDLRLGKGYSITGRITDAQGRPVSDVLVTVDVDDPEKHVFANTQSGLDGKYTLTGVPDIVVNLKFWAPRAGLHGEITNVRPSVGGAQDVVLKAN